MDKKNLRDMRTFYDIHIHALNLSHPSLTAFMLRGDMKNLLDKLVKANKLELFMLGLGSVLFPSLTKKAILAKLNANAKSPLALAANCLAFFEIPLEYQFLVLEYFLTRGEPKIFNADNQLTVGALAANAFDKIALCPLAVDFGFKNIPDSIYYRLSPKRPIANQVGDLLYAIRTYYRFNLEVKDRTMHLSPEIEDFLERKHEKLFEIYPFMGLDTRNYTLEEVQRLLEKFFVNFTKDESGEARRKRLFEKTGKLDSNMYKAREEYADVFAGIKVYPQLGFDPWPEPGVEREKVCCLYEFCEDRRVPITAHCSDGGYKTGDHDAKTSPTGRWADALKKHPNLTLNFAHFGEESNSPKRQWRNAIIALAAKYPNVYADISCNDATPDYYDELENLFKPDPKSKFKNLPPVHNPDLHKKILFGSDFSINLLGSKVNSYNEYLKTFTTARLSHKTDLCEKNPRRFLFGE